MSTRDLIDAITSGDATGVESSFNTIMAAKVSDKIDSMRNDVAQNMFTSPAEETDVEETEAVDSDDFEDSEYEDGETVEETEEENE
jgi:hypothetical protein